MILMRLLQAPWLAANAKCIGMGIAGASVMAAGLAFVAVMGTIKPAAAASSAIVTAVGAAIIWAFLLPNLLALEWTAHNLRLPRAQLQVIACLVLYALLTVVAPALGLSLLGVPPAAALLILTILAGIGFLCTMLPGYLGVLVLVLPALLSLLPPLPMPTDPEFLPWALKVATAIVLTGVLRWRQLQFASQAQLQGMRRPMLLVNNPGLQSMCRQAGRQEHMATHRRPWRRQRAQTAPTNVPPTRPAHPQRAIQVALGRGYLPQFRTSLAPNARRALWGALWLALVLLLVLHNLHAGGNLKLDVIMLLLLNLGAMFGLGVLVVTVHQYLQQWRRKHSGEVALLALLPGLGQPAAATRHLLRAVLSGPLLVIAGTWLLTLAIAITAPIPTPSALLVSAQPLLWAGILVGVVLRVLAGSGGDRFDAFGFRVIHAGFTLTFITAIGVTVTDSALPTLIALGLAWLALALGLSAMAWRDWHSLQARPHPFMLESR